jgi:hypothetical protein
VLGKPDAQEITVEDVSDTARIFSQARFNGDGVVPAQAAGDPALSSVIDDIVACLGGQADRSGAQGATGDSIERFYAEAASLAGWWDLAKEPGILPFGDDTAARHEAYRAIRGKVEDYFQRCRLAAYDGKSALLLCPADAEYQQLSATTLDGGTDWPDSRCVPAAAKPLPLAAGEPRARRAAAVRGGNRRPHPRER